MENFLCQQKNAPIASKAIMSPLTTKAKYLHYGRQGNTKLEAVKAVASSEDGVGEMSIA